jgi:glycosyltransferase involved in cell wall biosynthesis
MAREYRRQNRRLALLPRYDSIVTLSRHMRDEYLRHGIPPARVHCVSSLTEAREAGSDGHVPAPAAGDGPCRLAFVGRMDHLKGCRVLLEALPAVSAAVGRVVLTVAGDGPDMHGCRRLADQLSRDTKIEVVFLGWAAGDVRREVLARTDVLVMPSLWPEPHGLAGLEALRQGVPVTAFAAGGIPEWLQEGVNGTLAPANPPTAAGLASAIIRCVTTPSIRKALENRRQSADPSVEDHVDAVSGLMRRAIDSRSRCQAGLPKQKV